MKIALVVLIAVAVLYAGLIALGINDEASVENSVFIARPPEVVFDYAADMRHELEWNPDVVTMKKLTDGPIGLGTRYAARWKQSEDVVVTVERYDRPRALTLVNGGTLETTVAVTVAPEGIGSRFTSRFTARPHGFMKVIFPIFRLMMAKFEKANMGYLKRAIESSSNSVVSGRP